MKTSVFSHWLHHHLEKQPHYIKKLLKHSAVLRTNQEAIARSMAIALFMSCIPIPFHSVLVILMAIFLAANPLIAFNVLWIVNNPFTMAPIYYGCYRIGLWILQLPPQPFEFDTSWQWVIHELAIIWQPFLLGCLVSGITLGLVTYLMMRLFYRLRSLTKFSHQS